MYICVKLPPEDLNLNPCFPHLTNTCAYEMIIAPRVRSGILALHLVPFELVIFGHSTYPCLIISCCQSTYAVLIFVSLFLFSYGVIIN